METTEMKSNHFGKIPGAVGKCAVMVSMRDIVRRCSKKSIIYWYNKYKRSLQSTKKKNFMERRELSMRKEKKK